MSKYRRTIITLDDKRSKKDYMLFCVFEKLWPDMEEPWKKPLHKLDKDVDKNKRFDVGIHVDEVTINVDVSNNPLPHVTLNSPVEMLWGGIVRDPDAGNHGFLLKRGHKDIDSITAVLPQSESVQEIWAWFDTKREVSKLIASHDIKLTRIGGFTKKLLGFDISSHALHVGCVYVVHYSAIKNVSVETVPMMPAVRCEIHWRNTVATEDVMVKVTEKVVDRMSSPNVFVSKVAKGKKFALVKMTSRPHKIDIDITNAQGDTLFFLRNVSFLGTVVSGNPRPSRKNATTQSAIVGIEHYLKPAILAKEAKIKRERMEFVFFDGDPLRKTENKDAAKACVERMLQKSKKQVVIGDPYFSAGQFNEYICGLEDNGIEIVIINCKEQLEQVASGQKVSVQDVINKLETAIKTFNGKGTKSRVSCYCLGGQGRLHDRFVLTESDGWLIGSSLSEFGNRACSIVKLSESALMTLGEIVSRWINDPKIWTAIG